MKPDFGTTYRRPFWLAESLAEIHNITLAARLASEERFGGEASSGLNDLPLRVQTKCRRHHRKLNA